MQYILNPLFKQGMNTKRLMKYYPVFLDIKDKFCLVVGGGKVGTRKAIGLASANARVRVVSLDFSRDLVEARFDNICLDKKFFDPQDLNGVCLVFAATDSRELNARIKDAARRAGILCNIADGKDKGDFILPSVVNRGNLQVAVSTGGASPALARRLRQDLQTLFGSEYETMLRLMANIRKKMLAQGHDPEGHKKIFTDLVDQDLPAMIADGNIKKIDAVLARLPGDGFTFEGLTDQAPSNQEL